VTGVAVAGFKRPSGLSWLSSRVMEFSTSPMAGSSPIRAFHRGGQGSVSLMTFRWLRTWHGCSGAVVPAQRPNKGIRGRHHVGEESKVE
jgi:hypothetical protein